MDEQRQAAPDRQRVQCLDVQDVQAGDHRPQATGIVRTVWSLARTAIWGHGGTTGGDFERQTPVRQKVRGPWHSICGLNEGCFATHHASTRVSFPDTHVGAQYACTRMNE